MTFLHNETHEIPEKIRYLLKENVSCVQALAQKIRERQPDFAITLARGSSDHAATFAKYAFETQMGLVTASFAPSVHTVYQAKPNLKNAFALAISQSGASPDIVESLAFIRAQGALTAAIVNDLDSPLAKTAEFVIPMHAGSEKSVAATKTYLTSLMNILLINAAYTADDALKIALSQLPDRLALSLQMNWQTCIDHYQHHSDTLTIGRGFSYPIAQEAALKFKETAGIHAEAFSGAEVLHGPYALIKNNYPVLIFCQSDASLANLIALATQAKQQHAHAMLVVPESITIDSTVLRLPIPDFLHPMCDPLMSITSFYNMINALAIARGYDPDQPQHLNKITKTR